MREFLLHQIVDDIMNSEKIHKITNGSIKHKPQSTTNAPRDGLRFNAQIYSCMQKLPNSYKKNLLLFLNLS